MTTLNNEYDENLADYEFLEKNNIFIHNIISPAQLEIIDNLLMSFITEQWRKTAFVIGKTMKALKENNPIELFGKYKDFEVMLLAQRIDYLVTNQKIKSNGNNKAIRFSELRI
jgi:hypothetical protein